MSNPESNDYLRTLMWAIVISASINSLFVVAAWQSVAPNGSDSGLWFTLILVFPACGAIIVVPVVLLLAIPKHTRAFALRAALSLVIYTVVGMIAINVGNSVRMYGFARLAERSVPLINAIKQFETDKGRPPAELADLVPEYLPAVPTTGMNAYPEYEYLIGEKAERHEGNPWVLMVFTPSGGINFDQFVYFPKGNYLKSAYSAWLERVGDWAYYHE